MARMRHQSDSSVQLDAQAVISRKLEERVGKRIRETTVALGGGAQVRVDGVDPEETVFVEIFAHQGALKGGQKHKVATDALKLITIGRTRPDAELILAFADEDAAAFATKGSWMSEALAAWGVTVYLVDIDSAVRDGIKDAQLRQEMVNPTASASADP